MEDPEEGDGESPQTGDAGRGDAGGRATADGGTTPEAAFALLGDETRMAILEALWEEYEPGPADDPISFSRLRAKVEVTPSSRFNYHLGELVGRFVRKTDEGYVLAEAGFRVVRAVMAGAITDDATFEGVELDLACPLCGAPTAAHNRNELLNVACTECPGLVADESLPEGTLVLQVFPPAGQQDRTPAAATRAFLPYVYLRVRTMLQGICPECAGTVSGSLDVCEDHELPGGSDELCRSCGTRYPVWPRLICDNCKFSTIYPPWFRALAVPEVAAFCRDHGVDSGPALTWETWRALGAVDTRVVSTGPLVVEVTFEVDDETVTATMEGSRLTGPLADSTAEVDVD
jgi:hypothetical protein